MIIMRNMTLILVMYAVRSIKCVSEVYTYLYNRNNLGVEMIMGSPLSPSHLIPLQLCWLPITMLKRKNERFMLITLNPF